MPSGKGCNFWLISGWFVRYFCWFVGGMTSLCGWFGWFVGGLVGLWVVWLVCGWSGWFVGGFGWFVGGFEFYS